MPYAEDESKRARYRAFLETHAGLRDVLPERASGASIDEWVKEMQEFAQAAQVFRPMTGMMASRFTSSSKTFEGTFNEDPPAADGSSLIRVPTGKPEDPAEAAAKIGMFGPMTRSVHRFLPTRLVCKRFGIRPPENVDLDPGAMGGDVGVASTVSEVVSQFAMDQMMREAAIRRPVQTRDPEGSGEFANLSVSEPVAVVDSEKNEALEAERPGDAVFKAIFGSDDDDDSD
jgi:G patch domain-containing protein 1